MIKIQPINTRDLKLIQQRAFSIRVKIDVYDEKSNTHLDQLEGGIQNAAFTISAESDVRRTVSLTVTPLKNNHLRLEKDSVIWMNRIIRLEIGIYDHHYETWHWYPQGVYVFTDYGASYNAETNTLSLSLSDLWANLDGSRSGQVGGAADIPFPAYEEDPDTGEIIMCYTIRDAVRTTLTQLGGLSESRIQLDEIGELKGMPQYNPDYLQYREESKILLKDGSAMPLWNTLPYDQEFSAGSTIASILTTLRDLYPNYEMYFDEYGNFICRMIPSCFDDEAVLDHAFFDRIYISENTSVNMTGVRNICEVWGKTIDADFYTDNCTYSGGCYSCHADAYPASHQSGIHIAVKIPSANETGAALRVNDSESLPIFDENTEAPVTANVMEAGQVYVFRIKKKYAEGSTVTRAYLLGQFQPHAVDILTNGAALTKDYFQQLYHCNIIHFTVIPDSPFCIEELGLLPDVKTGGEYENITSDSLALARAEYENWKNSRLTDSINITTKLCPFADINIKVSYRRKDTGQINQYLVKSISHDPAGGTTSWTLMRFYPPAAQNP